MKANGRRKKQLMILSVLGLFTLVSCQTQALSSSMAASSSATTSSSTGGSSSGGSSQGGSSSTSSSAAASSSAVASSSVSVLHKSLTLTLSKTTIASGTTFYDGCNPIVTFNDGIKDIDLSGYSIITWAISKTGSTSTYNPGDVLTSGSYTATARYSKYSLSAKASFTVKAVAIATGSEGAGYKQADFATAENNQILGKQYGTGALGYGKLPSIGSPKLLVVPVTFSDATSFSASDITKIDNAFFGEATSTGWQSLKSYYATSSYGKLQISGTVLSTAYVYPGTSLEFENAYSSSGSATDALVNLVTAWLPSQGINSKNFDSNSDGYIDGVELVYNTSRPNKQQDSSTSLWWNYTSVVEDNTPNVTQPVGYRYFWSLYSYISNNYYTPNLDCHTLIHESGHMLGLDDYYSYDNNEYPAGCVDMMDLNVGDHNAYSKYMLGWTAPMVIDGSSSNFSLKLNSFTDTGEWILLRNTTTDPWNGTPYDEYLALQYYTPTGMNETDSTGYPEWAKMGHGGTYAKAGLQVFHVDSRLCHTYGTYDVTTKNNAKKTITSAHIAYSDDIIDDDEYKDDGTFATASFTPASNTGTRSLDVKATEEGQNSVYNSSFRLLKAITASGDDLFSGASSYSSFGVQTNLFGISDYGAGRTTYSTYAMSANYAKGLTFNDGSTLNWTFTVTRQSDSSCSIHFIEN